MLLEKRIRHTLENNDDDAFELHTTQLPCPVHAYRHYLPRLPIDTICGVSLIHPTCVPRGRFASSPGNLLSMHWVGMHSIGRLNDIGRLDGLRR